MLPGASGVFLSKWGPLQAVSDPDSFQPYDEVDPSNFINSISRERINNLLITTSEALPNVEIFFGHRLTQITPDGGAVFESNGTAVYVTPRLILGTDGAYRCVSACGVRVR